MNVRISNNYDWPHNNGRRPGCKSPNHRDCHGMLWQCPQCKRWLCCAEGVDDKNVDVCDSCAATVDIDK